MVKISDKTDYCGLVRPRDEDEGIWLDHVEVHLVTHPVGQVKQMHVHDPPQDHVIVMRSGRMRWTVEDQTLEAGPQQRRRAGESRLRRHAEAAEAGLIGLDCSHARRRE